MEAMEQVESILLGEVHCLNCGRTLAEALQNPQSGKIRLRPAANQVSVEVEVVDRHTLRCHRCHGRALLEGVLPEEIPFSSRSNRSARSFVSAA